MTDKDRPTRQFVRNEKRELLTAEGKSYEPPIFYCVFYDWEDSDYKLRVFSEAEDETEKKIAAFGGIVDKTYKTTAYDPCPIGFLCKKKVAAKALKEGRLREFIEDAVKKDYDKWHEELPPDIRDLLIDFSLSYWRRELFDYYGEVDGEGEDEPEGPAENIDTEPNIIILPTGSTFND